MRKPVKTIAAVGQRNSPLASSRYRPLLANGEGNKKRVSDTQMDGGVAAAARLAAALGGGQSVGSPLLNGKHSTYGRPRKQRAATESDLANHIPIQPKERISSTGASLVPRPVSFDWTSYLKEVGASAVPVSHFIHVPLEIQNVCSSGRLGSQVMLPSSFKPDQCMEGIDPHHESLFCALKVTEVTGRRLRLRFIGYPEKYDFWTTVDSPFLFPVGWCARNKRRLQPPKGYADRDQNAFRWDTFLAKEKLTAVPRHLFRVPWDCPFNDPPSHMFHVGHKLEAVDKRNPGIACVATVKDTIGDYVLIHFDGWQSGFDQWAHISSELLHPVGYCEDQELVLSIPSDWSARPTGFTWKQYLKETNSKPVPNEAFGKFPKSASLQIGQRLEAVDKRCLQLIRVAQIVSHSPPGFLTISYDGWADKYNVCIEANSLDLFPVGYCQATGHPLQPPPGHELEIDANGALGDAHSTSSTSSVNTVQTGSCPTSGCKGYGHVKGPRYSTHQRISGCPYADINMKRDLIRPHERLNACAIISPIPDSTSPSHMPKLDQAVPISSHTSIIPDLTSGSSLSPDSSVKTDLFVVSNTSSLSPSPCVLNADNMRSSKYANTSSSVSPSAAQLGINGVTTDLPRTCLTNSVYVFDSLPAFDLTPPIEKIKPDNINAHLLPLDLSVERQRTTATNRASTVKNAKPSKLKRIDLNNGCDAVLETTTSISGALVVDPVTSQSPPQLTGTHFNDLGGNATSMIDKASSNCNEQLSDAIAPVVVSGSKRSLSDNSKPAKQETKPRLSQIANVANDYARQQQMFGLTGLPVKRKRGRPRKYTTINMIHTACSRSVPQPTAPQARNSMPTVPFSYSANIPGTLSSVSGTAPAIPSSTVMPTLSIYTPLTVGAPLPGLYSTTGLLIPSSAVSVCGDQAHAIPSLSPATWNPDSTSTSGTVATNISSQHSGSTEPATVSRSPTTLDSASLSTMDNQPTSMPSLSAVHSSAYDFCPTNTLNNSGPCTDSVLSGSVSLPACPPDPFPAPSLHRLADSSTLFPGWCMDPVATGSCMPINPTAFCVPPHMYLDPPRYTGLPSSALDQLCPPRISLDSMDTRSDDLDLLGRLLPQTQAALRASKVAGLAGPHVWNVEMVGSFVSTLPGCRQFATKFTDNEIDGAALLCLEQHDLMQILGMKLGPAVKVAGAIQTLRRNLMATPVSELGPDHIGALAAAASCFSTSRLSCSAASDLNPSGSADKIRSTSDSGRAPTHNVTSTGDSR